MLEKFKKYFNPASAETQEEVNMTTQTEQADMSVETNTAEMSALVEQMASLSASFAELQGKYQEAQAALSEVEKAKSALIADAAATKFAARKEKMEAVVGTEKAETLLAATSAMDDAQFATMIDALSTSFKAESQSKMFTETGVTAEAVVAEVDPVASLAAAIEKKYNTNAKKV